MRPSGIDATARSCAVGWSTPLSRAKAFSSPSQRSVSTGPGLTVFTRMPCGPYCSASDEAKLRSAALAAPGRHLPVARLQPVVADHEHDAALAALAHVREHRAAGADVAHELEVQDCRTTAPRSGSRAGRPASSPAHVTSTSIVAEALDRLAPPRARRPRAGVMSPGCRARAPAAELLHGAAAACPRGPADDGDAAALVDAAARAVARPMPRLAPVMNTTLSLRPEIHVTPPFQFERARLRSAMPASRSRWTFPISVDGQLVERNDALRALVGRQALAAVARSARRRRGLAVGHHERRRPPRPSARTARPRPRRAATSGCSSSAASTSRGVDVEPAADDQLLAAAR